MHQKTANQRTVAVALYQNVNAFELSVATEVFALERPELGIPWYRTFICSIDGSPISTRVGFSIVAPYTFSQLAEVDTIIVPSTTPGSTVFPPELLAALRTAYQQGARIVSFCTGAFVLAAAGLLDDRTVATHWMWSRQLAEQYPRVRVNSQALYVDEGQILTSAGTAAAIDLALHIVRKDYGADIAAAVARRMVVPPIREGNQAQYFDFPLLAPGESIPFSAVLDWMQKHLHEELSIERLASELHMSQRTFARKFRSSTGTTPHRWLLQQRLLQAQRLLEKTSESIERIAFNCGFPSAAMLRINFQRAVGVSPQQYRQRLVVNRSGSE